MSHKMVIFMTAYPKLRPHVMSLEVLLSEGSAALVSILLSPQEEPLNLLSYSNHKPKKKPIENNFPMKATRFAHIYLLSQLDYVNFEWLLVITLVLRISLAYLF